MNNYQKDLELLYRGCEKDCSNCELGKISKCIKYEAYERLSNLISKLTLIPATFEDEDCIKDLSRDVLLKIIGVLKQYLYMEIILVTSNSYYEETHFEAVIKSKDKSNTGFEVRIIDEDDIALLQNILV